LALTLILALFFRSLELNTTELLCRCEGHRSLFEILQLHVSSQMCCTSGFNW